MEKQQQTNSIWQKIETSFLPALSMHHSTDVCILGSGIAGLSVAYQLLREGVKVAVLDREGLAEGETAHTSAHLSYVFDHRFFDILRWHGKDKARSAVQSHRAAIDEIERICLEQKIDCDFRRVDGFLFQGEDRPASELEREFQAARECGIDDVEMLERAPSHTFQIGKCLRFPNQATFHPQKYRAGLARAVRSLGGRIFLHTAALEIQEGRPLRVSTSCGFQVICEDVVAACNAPFAVPPTMHTKVAPYRTYVVGYQMPKDQGEPELFWDTSDPYHYLRFVPGEGAEGDLLLVGGEDHRVGQDDEGEDHFGNLRNWVKERLGIARPAEIHWSGQVLETPDGLAYIGRNPKFEDSVYLVTGDCGQGLTHGTIAGILLCDLIQGRENRWADIYEPSRLHVTSLKNYVEESWRGAASYADWATTGDVGSVDEIPRGEGAVIRQGIDKVAAYKDGQGHVHLYSAVCPHMKGIVRWNGSEKTFDCPCHGSRFDRTGKVINGPALCGLKEIVGREVEERKQASA